jgi:hypothetical protein
LLDTMRAACAGQGADVGSAPRRVGGGVTPSCIPATVQPFGTPTGAVRTQGGQCARCASREAAHGKGTRARPAAKETCLVAASWAPRRPRRCTCSLRSRGTRRCTHHPSPCNLHAVFALSLCEVSRSGGGHSSCTHRLRCSLLLQGRKARSPYHMLKRQQWPMTVGICIVYAERAFSPMIHTACATPCTVITYRRCWEASKRYWTQRELTVRGRELI